MELLKNTHIDFMRWRRFWITVSFLTIVAGIGSIFVHGRINTGIDFAGGTQLIVKFHDAPNLSELRSILGSAGFSEAEIQQYGVAADRTVLVRTPIQPGTEEGSGGRLVAALNTRFNGAAGAGMDLNRAGSGTIADQLAAADPDGVGKDAAPAHYQAVAEALMSARKATGLFASWDEVAKIAGLSPKALATLKQQGSLGSFAVLSTENVGPQVGSELRRRGLLAVIFALFGMLVYIWFRFELRFGVGATMATLHDVLITLGFFAFAGYEFNLTTIAGFLTLVGYSVNDTVVTFDRLRENMRKHRGVPLIDLMNMSINQTLSRTILTGGTVLLAALSLFLLGGEVIRGFAFIMLVGTIVGTYSSVYIASPFALLWDNLFPQSRAGEKSRPAVERGRPAPERQKPVAAPPTAPAGRPSRVGGGRARAR